MTLRQNLIMGQNLCPTGTIRQRFGVGRGFEKEQAQTVRKMRLNPSSKHYRKPPEGWNRTVAKLAQREAKKLMGLAEKLRKG